MSSYIYSISIDKTWSLEFHSHDTRSWHQWRVLAHVCQRWRHIIFAWPNYLNVRIDCESRTAAVKALDVWPALPITIEGMSNYKDRDSIIDVLEHRDRIVGIDLSGLTGPQLKVCATLMQEPFSILRTLSLSCNAEIPPVISDMFLGGCPSPPEDGIMACPISNIAKISFVYSWPCRTPSQGSSAGRDYGGVEWTNRACHPARGQAYRGREKSRRAHEYPSLSL